VSKTREYFTLTLQLHNPQTGQPNIDSMFLVELTELPLTYTYGQLSGVAYQSLISSWGTHATTQITYGAQMTVVTHISKCSNESIQTWSQSLLATLDELLQVAPSSGSGQESEYVGPSASLDYYTQTQSTSILTSSGLNFQSTLGACTASVTACNWTTFLNAVTISNVGIINTQALDLWVLVQDLNISNAAVKAANLRNASADYYLNSKPLATYGTTNPCGVNSANTVHVKAAQTGVLMSLSWMVLAYVLYS